MSRKTRLGSFLFTFLLVMALSAIIRVPALADDGPPPGVQAKVVRER